MHPLLASLFKKNKIEDITKLSEEEAGNDIAKQILFHIQELRKDIAQKHG